MILVDSNRFTLLLMIIGHDFLIMILIIVILC